MVDKTSITEFKTKFKQTVKENIRRKGIDDLLNYLDNTDFYTAPSSARFHGCIPGGLCQHSIKVYECLKELQGDKYSNESVAIVSLFHDLCKINFYSESTRNTKDENGKWIQVPYYTYRQDDPLPLGHGEKSLAIVMQYMQLTPEEMCAIRWHMGGFYTSNPSETTAISQALSAYHLVLDLQTADQRAAFWYGK